MQLIYLTFLQYRNWSGWQRIDLRIETAPSIFRLVQVKHRLKPRIKNTTNYIIIVRTDWKMLYVYIIHFSSDIIWMHQKNRKLFQVLLSIVGVPTMTNIRLCISYFLYASDPDALIKLTFHLFFLSLIIIFHFVVWDGGYFPFFKKKNFPIK